MKKLLLNSLLLASLITNAQCWESVSNGETHVMGIKLNGTLWGWGRGDGGLNGNGGISANEPQQIGTSTDWKSVHAGFQHSLGIKDSGILWAWGSNLDGNLGTGSTAMISTVPVQVGSNTWKTVSAGGRHSLGIRTNGTLWAWGLNTNGQLGLGTETNHSVPVQIGTDTNWETVQARKYTTTMATKTDGTVWYWGTNYYGEFGNGLDFQEIYFTTPQLSPNICVTSLSTPSFEQKNNVTLYPNPVQNRLFINTQETQRYQIYSILGSKISEGTLTVGSGIDCSGLISGVYFISLTNGLGLSSRLKFVKQ